MRSFCSKSILRRCRGSLFHPIEALESRRLLSAGGGAAVGIGKETVYLRDSFGFEPITADGGTRFDAAGNVVPIFLSHDLSGLRAEYPNNSTEVWTAPHGHQA